jgi:hypothetical protein
MGVRDDVAAVTSRREVTGCDQFHQARGPERVLQVLGNEVSCWPSGSRDWLAVPSANGDEIAVRPPMPATMTTQAGQRTGGLASYQQLRRADRSGGEKEVPAGEVLGRDDSALFVDLRGRHDVQPRSAEFLYPIDAMQRKNLDAAGRFCERQVIPVDAPLRTTIQAVPRLARNSGARPPVRPAFRT